MEGAEVSAEVTFAQKLASNEKKIRDRFIKRLQKYLNARSCHGGLTDPDLIKIWKGLHYCMWMQDKPLLQEELSDRISGLIRSFPSAEGALQFMRVFLETEAREWNGIDKLRLDKFMMMIRDMLREIFTRLSKAAWPLDECRQLAQDLATKVMLSGDERLPDGLKMHLADIYIDEMEKVSLEGMTSRKMILLLRPFIDFIISTTKIELASRIMHEVVNKTINTMSTIQRTLESEENVSLKSKKALKQQSSETGDDEEEDMETEEDNVDGDAEERSFKLDGNLLLYLLFKLAKGTTVRAANRAIVYNLIKKHPEIYDNIINTLNSSQEETFKDSVNEGESYSLGDLALFHDEESKDLTQHRKKKRKSKKRQAEEVAQSEESESQLNSGSSIQVKTAIHPSGSSNDLESSKSSKTTDKKLSAKSKKRKRNCDEEEGDTQAGHAAVSEPKLKKTELKGEVYVREKSTSDDNLSVTPITAGQTDQNNNAGRHQGSKTLTSRLHLSPLEVVTYPEKKGVKERKSRKTSARSNAKVREVESPQPVTPVRGVSVTFVETGSPPRSKGSPCPTANSNSAVLAAALTSASAERKKSKKSPKSKPSPTSDSAKPTESPVTDGGDCTPRGEKAKHSASPKLSDSNGSIIGSVLSSIKQNYVDPLLSLTSQLETKDGSETAMDFSEAVTSKEDLTMRSQSSCDEALTDSSRSRSDPGPSKKQKKKDAAKTSVTPATPSQKKKVVFNLRRNSANKFQDYIQSLQRQPKSPHIPQKSPSNSILKASPSPSTTAVAGGRKTAGGKVKKRPGVKSLNQKSKRSPEVKIVRSRSNVRRS